jgi:peptidoglycan/xylan/chitin deacetylase (PgdA/CDA1 family)
MLLEAAGAGCAATALMAYAVRGPSTFFGPSVSRGRADRRSLAITFDDGPSESTPELLDILDRHRARATFFQCGIHVERLPGIAREVVARGHEIGNHTYSHPRLWKRTPKGVAGEVARAQAAIEDATGASPATFRPPYGERWFGLREVERRLGLTDVKWSVLAWDWRLPAGRVAGRLLAAASPGAILCLHDGRDLAVRPDISATLEAVRLLLPALADRGFRFETVSEILCPTN